jgi:hypothetical protein
VIATADRSKNQLALNAREVIGSNFLAWPGEDQGLQPWAITETRIVSLAQQQTRNQFHQRILASVIAA